MKLEPKLSSGILGAFAIGALAVGVNATPVVTYTLSINDNGMGTYTVGDFAVYASDSSDNGGIAGFSVGLTGATTVTNMAPREHYLDANSNVGDAGFTSFNAADATNTTETVTGSQDLPGTDYSPVFGFGQVSGSLGLPPGNQGAVGKAIQSHYTFPLVLAVGTYSGAPNSLFFTPPISSNELANVYTTNGSDANTIAPTIAVVTQTLAAPEPATLALLTCGALALLANRRKMRA